jgi:predicted transcriptional regulator
MCPMGIVSNEDFEKSIKQSKIEIAKVDDIKKGRGEGTKNVPDEIRALAAQSAISNEGTGENIARAFGISPSSVSAYKVGAHSTTSYDKPNQDLFDKITGHKQRITKRALKTALSALSHLTPENLSNVKARDLAAIAKDMTAIIADMEPKVPINQNNQQNNVQFVFMAPRVREISEYQTIQVNE